jgi:hypothetical protein
MLDRRTGRSEDCPDLQAPTAPGNAIERVSVVATGRQELSAGEAVLAIDADVARARRSGPSRKTKPMSQPSPMSQPARIAMPHPV